jgi:hypothetical protein
MLERLGCNDLEELLGQCVPAEILLPAAAALAGLPDGCDEGQALAELAERAAANQPHRSLIGLGYYDCWTPALLQRHVFENPAWYTAYTPYQAEIAQGRLEALLNFQTLITELTGLPIANASLLDEATAAAEAMALARSARGASGARHFHVLLQLSVFKRQVGLGKSQCRDVPGHQLGARREVKHGVVQPLAPVIGQRLQGQPLQPRMRPHVGTHLLGGQAFLASVKPCGARRGHQAMGVGLHMDIDLHQVATHQAAGWMDQDVVAHRIPLGVKALQDAQGALVLVVHDGAPVLVGVVHAQLCVPVARRCA